MVRLCNPLYRKMPISCRMNLQVPDHFDSQTARIACPTAIPFALGALPITAIAISPTAPGRFASRERRDPPKGPAAKEGDRGHSEGSRECRRGSGPVGRGSQTRGY